MTQHFWVVGTDTGIGKTLITTYFMQYFQAKGAKVIPYKPIQTGLIEDGEQQYYEDTAFYQTFSNTNLVEKHMNSYSFKEPASPHYAAILEGSEIEENLILQHIKYLKNMYDHVICEGAGGLFVPLHQQRNYYLLDLVEESRLPAVLVTRSGLGTINHTLLSVEALQSRGIPVTGLVFNTYEGTAIERNNIETVQRLTGLPSLVMPKLADIAALRDIHIHNTEFFERLARL